jgi:hypothetical protein
VMNVRDARANKTIGMTERIFFPLSQ